MADMKDIKNGEEKSKKEFSDMESKTHEVYEMIKDLLKSTTEEEIEKLGFEKNEKVAGVYGDGSTYGAGVEENQYNVIVTSRPRKFDSSKNMSHGYGNGTFEKQIFIGAKRVESQVDFEIKGKTLHMQYRSPEAGFFRGVDDEGDTFMVRKQITVPLKDAKKELKIELKDAAQKEVGFLTHTKLGVEDRLDASTTSIVETVDMEKLTLKSLFADELDFTSKEVNEGYEKLPSDEEPNINAVKKLNKVEMPNADSNRFLLFDDEEQCEELIKELNLEEDEDFVKKLKDDYGVEGGDVSKLTPVEKTEFFNSLKKEAEHLEEITTSGPSVGGVQVGAGGYLPKLIGLRKRKFSKVGAPYSIPAGDPIYQEVDSINESNSSVKKSFAKTAYAKGQKSRPKVDKDYNVIPETKNTNASKPYTQVVKIDPNTHPLGMPFIKPNSKEELERTSGVGSDFDKMERMGLKEDDSSKTSRLVKRKFISDSEQKKKGINKRYIVTEKTNQQYEKERWNRLSTFNKYETISEAEELNSVIDNIDDYNEFFENKKQIVNESVYPETKSVEKTIEVEKTNSVFGITQKFYEKDFLNEGKQFILDLNSMVFVKNPNSK